MEQNTENAQFIIDGTLGELINKYNKTLSKVTSRIGRSITVPLVQNVSGDPYIKAFFENQFGLEMVKSGTEYVKKQEEFLLYVQTFIQSLETIKADGLKNKSSLQDIYVAFMSKQNEFSEKIGAYLEQANLLREDSTILHFFKELRTQMQFKTDESGEKILNYPAKYSRDYVKDDQFAQLYPSLVATGDDKDQLYLAFATDCGNLLAPQVQETINLTYGFTNK